jgi:opacity protein-like surface antigen
MKLSSVLLSSVAVLAAGAAYAADLPAKKAAALPEIQKPQVTPAYVPYIAIVGADFGNGWRAEVEGSYRRNSGSKYSITAEGNSALAIDKSTSAILLNLWHDFAINDQLSVHVGGGLGYANVNNSITASDGVHPDTKFDVNHSGLAYMAGTGISYALPGYNNIKLTLDYRVTSLPSGSADLSFLDSYVNYGDRTTNASVGGTNLDQWGLGGLRIPLSF